MKGTSQPPQFLDAQTAATYASWFKAFADPTRVRLVCRHAPATQRPPVSEPTHQVPGDRAADLERAGGLLRAAPPGRGNEGSTEQAATVRVPRRYRAPQRTCLRQPAAPRSSDANNRRPANGVPTRAACCLCYGGSAPRDRGHAPFSGVASGCRDDGTGRRGRRCASGPPSRTSLGTIPGAMAGIRVVSIGYRAASRGIGCLRRPGRPGRAARTPARRRGGGRGSARGWGRPSGRRRLPGVRRPAPARLRAPGRRPTKRIIESPPGRGVIPRSWPPGYAGIAVLRASRAGGRSIDHGSDWFAPPTGPEIRVHGTPAASAVIRPVADRREPDGKSLGEVGDRGVAVMTYEAPPTTDPIRAVEAAAAAEPGSSRIGSGSVPRRRCCHSPLLGGTV